MTDTGVEPRTKPIKRRRGKMARGQQYLHEKLRAFGGLYEFIMRQHVQGVGGRLIAQAIYDSTGVQVSHDYITDRLAEWEAGYHYYKPLNPAPTSYRELLTQLGDATQAVRKARARTVR